MTQTEKKYATNIGKLFLIHEKRYNQDKKTFEMEYALCMVYGMIRTGWTGKTGAYAYQINRLTHTDIEWRKDYSVRCKDFVGEGNRRYAWQNTKYELLTKENMELVGKVVDIKQDE